MLPMMFLATVLAAEPSDAQRELLTRFRAEFVALTPGEGKYPAKIEIGSAEGPAAERPVREVTFRPFSIAKYEVPQNLWEAVMGENPSRWKGPRNSVERLSWDEAVEFCAKATKLMRAGELIGTEEVIRLPSEAEWEYAARAGTTTRYSFGEGIEQIDEFAWYTGNAAGNDPEVGVLKPNPWGLYDIHGYLWEWCQDDWHPTYEMAPVGPEPRRVEGEKQRVLRGGSWKNPADRLTSSYRQPADRGVRDDAIGLRCVLAKE